MEKGKVPLTAQTWRPILLCGLLLASKVWQDYASWNIEFSHVYPQVRSSPNTPHLSSLVTSCLAFVHPPYFPVVPRHPALNPSPD